MKDIIKLAFRNLREHKSKTIILCMFLTFGIAIVIAGNSFLESINRGLEKDFRANYTADIVIAPENPKNAVIDLFGVNSMDISGEVPLLPSLPDTEKALEVIKNHEGIKSTTRLISAQVIVGEYNEENEFDLSALTEKDDLSLDDIPISLLFAGDYDTYWDTLSEVNFIEGTYPAPGTTEIIIDTRVADAYERLFGKKINVGDKVFLASMQMTLRDATVSGIFKPSNEHSAMFQIIYCNPDLARTFAKLTYASNIENELPDSVDLGLSAKVSSEDFSDDDLFSGDDIFFEDTGSTDILSSSKIDFDNILGDTSLRDKLNQTDNGAWNFIIARAENPMATGKLISELMKEYKDAGMNVQVMNWEQAAYSYTGSVAGIGLVFNILIIILAIVVFIIIMNTMVVSVFERTREIGTMRAIGASQKFVKKLFFSEAMMITISSSVFGIIISFIAMGIFNSFQIEIENSIAKMILGGGLLSFTPTVTIVVTTVIIALAGSYLSALYPVKSALKITPAKALASGE